MHKRLSKSPISYVLAQIRFTSIESIKKYIPEIQDKIRHDFPIFQKITIHALEMREDGQPSPSIIHQWHFMDKDSVTGILLDGKSITIHTSKYDQFDGLISKLKKALGDMNEILNISLFVRLGVRYINIVENNLDEYIKKGLLGFHLEGKSFDKNKYLVNSELTQKSSRGLIRVKSTLFGSKEIISGQPNVLIPPELFNVANYLSFVHHNQPKDKFLMLDIDHSDETKGDFEIEKVISGLKDLQDAAYQAFHEAVTEKALKIWQ